MFELQVESAFDSAHALRGYKGKCENLHGHTWRVQIFLQGDKLNNIGIMTDFKDIKAVLGKVIDQLDHKNLNDLPQFQKDNPSSENVAKWIYGELKKELPGLVKVSVWESPTSCASYFS
ncbi:MAG: 6-carboxytetrahydropterin synthase QueD [Candidatus Margulisbacteria bacterium]|nr:6-carboxytetrahydropterin synthase QueD [Candidatus Margulisiibacteriota bacterium]MBU1021783.1 6-carboxytetrahydropterin synthase QueD [Candidatus Margulisiibacteriota bacterium]MBU1729529.1 6-carboxytetrahydropterin synthase QueD [Candidatus Margulisiibacteriota bacterium]MBU1955370.1 6-carboxytetrahydropterin synthase QueD [Candidatus Margulisiibacteriota bacterium]